MDSSAKDTDEENKSSAKLYSETDDLSSSVWLSAKEKNGFLMDAIKLQGLLALKARQASLNFTYSWFICLKILFLSLMLLD